MTPFREIVESDMPDDEKLDMIGGILDRATSDDAEMAFIVDMIVYLFEKLDKHRADPAAHVSFDLR